MKELVSSVYCTLLRGKEIGNARLCIVQVRTGQRQKFIEMLCQRINLTSKNVLRTEEQLLEHLNIHIPHVTFKVTEIDPGSFVRNQALAPAFYFTASSVFRCRKPSFVWALLGSIVGFLFITVLRAVL